MGKGDKKTRRGKIVIGSFGKSRPRRIQKAAVPAQGKATTAEEAELAAVKAAKKAAKKAEPAAEAAVEKPKAAKPKKKATDAEPTAEVAPEAPAQE